MRIFTAGKRLRGFRLPFVLLVRELGKKDATSVVSAAEKLFWVRRSGDDVQLTAAGIDIAKRRITLDDSTE